MSDKRLRTLERQALAGDEDARQRLVQLRWQAEGPPHTHRLPELIQTLGEPQNDDHHPAFPTKCPRCRAPIIAPKGVNWECRPAGTMSIAEPEGTLAFDAVEIWCLDVRKETLLPLRMWLCGPLYACQGAYSPRVSTWTHRSRRSWVGICPLTQSYRKDQKKDQKKEKK